VSQNSQAHLAALSRMGILLAIYQRPFDVAQEPEGERPVKGPQCEMDAAECMAVHPPDRELPRA
jgi:hypothetical protein